MRRVHPHAASDWLWPGKKGGVTDSGLQQMVDRRATQAGVAHVHSHQLRHTYAHSFLAEGGNQGDLMMLGPTAAGDWRPAVGASTLLFHAAEIVTSGFPPAGGDEAVLGAFAVAGEAVVALLAVPGKGVALGVAESPLLA